jgi:molybdate transport system regulatory protein
MAANAKVPRTAAKVRKGEGTTLVPSWNLLLPGGATRGEDRIALLRAIRATGRLLEAAKACGISYRSAWNWVQELNRSQPEPLVLSTAGGRDGGTTMLSPEATRLLQLHDAVSSFLVKAATDKGLQAEDLDALFHFQRRLSMKTSVRNQFLGTVRSVSLGAVNAEVVLTLRGGDGIVAQVTNESVRNLGIAVGSEAWVLVKSSWIALCAGEQEPRLSARNRLKGVVRSILKGAVNDEVSLELSGGELLTAVITEESVKALDLKEGAPAWAVFKANTVILAVN